MYVIRCQIRIRVIKMVDLQTVGRLLLLLGGLIVVIGLILIVGGRYFSWFGQLPGDIQFQRGNISCFFPLATSIVVSIILTILANVVIRLLNR